MDSGANILSIGMAGTEEMYWAVTEFDACAGIEITASHNPINYNGMKIVKSGSQPLHDLADFAKIKKIAESRSWEKITTIGKIQNIAINAKQKYVDKVLSFIEVKKLSPLKIVINSGNGAAGPTLGAILNRLKDLGVPDNFVKIHHNPDSTFPNGIPNPLLKENHPATANVVIQERADMGIAFDGDFDRCFFFDEKGNFLPGEYIVGLLAEANLAKEPSANIIHDPRVIWNVVDAIKQAGGTALLSKTGHIFIKQAMRANKALYGGEISAHHYFRDFAYCDSGMIPWLMIWELISKRKSSLSSLIKDCHIKFPSSGEINFSVNDATACLNAVKKHYSIQAKSVDYTDGLSLTFEKWRFNLRRSNTEELVRLNIETRGDKLLLSKKTSELHNFIKNRTW